MGANKRQTTFAKRDRERQRMEKAALKRQRRHARTHKLDHDPETDTSASPVRPADEPHQIIH
jgi:hypothetical protein